MGAYGTCKFKANVGGHSPGTAMVFDFYAHMGSLGSLWNLMA